MLGPVSTRLDRRGLRPALSSSEVSLLFILIVLIFFGALAAPLAMWIDRIPPLWADLQERLSELRQPLGRLARTRTC